MFTGLVQHLATIIVVHDAAPGKRIVVHVPEIVDAERGESVAVNGCCLTVVEIDANGRTLAFDAGPETLARTNLGMLVAGSRVNIERSLRVGDHLGGHFVTGHIDVVGTLDSRHDDREWSTLWFRVPASLTSQMVSKGSIAVDGVSLTLVDVETDRFSVALIPHTLTITTLGFLKVGEAVNVETDLLAKYVQKAANGIAPQI
jgi:riboflavin synthase